MNKVDELVKRVRLTDKDLRKLAHEYFTVGNNKSTLQAGHWIGLVKFLLNRQLNKVLNDPDIAMKGERGFIYLAEALKEKR